jgi:hypothetical protein
LLRFSSPDADKFYREAGEMNTDRQIGDARSPAAAVNQPAESQHSCYVASAAVVDVLFDQLEYLVAHSGRDCPPGCIDCGRLERVQHWLLLPFHRSEATA